MGMVMFLIFLMTDLIMVGIFAVVYGKKDRYSEGMMLGVRIPPWAKEDSEVCELTENYRRQYKWFYWINAIFSIVVCFLCFWYFSVFMIVWCLWLCIFCAGSIGTIYYYHRRMYDLKVKKRWIAGETAHTVTVDTKLSGAPGKNPISYWWHLPVWVLSIAVLFLPDIRNYLSEEIPGWFLAGTNFAVSLLLTAGQVWFNYRRNIVYSNDSVLNREANMLGKRVWSIICIGTNYLNASSLNIWLFVLAKNRYLDMIDLLIFIALQIGIMGVFIWGIFSLRKKREEILGKNKEPVMVDDDVYWKNGWYSNPYDKHLWVQDRICSLNYTTNMAKPAGKILTGGTLVFVIITLFWVCAIMLQMDFGKRELIINGNYVEVAAEPYSVSFERKQVESIELAESLPDNLRRKNGSETEKNLIGKFTSKQMGTCRLYIYQGYQPILKIVLQDYTVFINSKADGQVEEWYEQLTKENQKEKNVDE